MSAVLEVRDLQVAVGGLPIVRGVDLTLAAGQRLGLVGESGSGKTLTALAIMGLHRDPIRVVGGQVLLVGTDLLRLRRRQLDKIRGAEIAMVYQDVAASLNPLITIGHQIVEAIRLHEPVPRAVALDRAADLLGEVGLANPRDRLSAYPHELSGGQRQRVMIAMALSAQPKALLCDEPTTALDVTTQARVIGLIDRICAQRGLSAILITHDLAVAGGFCDDIAVMYAGQIVEQAATKQLFATPLHPYSEALLSATVDLDTDLDRPVPAIPGYPPLPEEVDEHCSFRTRCVKAQNECRQVITLRRIGDSDVRCVLATGIPNGTDGVVR
ncbi:ABC transporter ATP-binding protein [Actinocrispum wychmicini]|uniref:Peptide/nickel transport system ATP-binding protein n=1 Tax=Actinocrispum wychmicini TaxID=1213861 RepID=A0A4R2JAP9_9PSEU|nr:ABC transporter ATP-binding protein [Actinocrispum wychmicini]TCO55864.1 peptide/nickel transport system ATP-binding protein [Actinocrispum wychmicini]